MNTLKDLTERYAGREFAGSGHYNVRFTIRGKEYSATTTNTLATDRLQESGYLSPRAISCGYTERQAMQSLYDEVKRKNGLR